MCYSVCMMRRWRAAAGFAVLALVLCGMRAQAAPLSPEDTVRRYLGAIKDEKFDQAYDLISKDMKQGKERAAWVKEQKDGMALAEVKIFDFTVYPGKVEGDTAHVPDVLSSQDRFVNQLGLTEHELYTLVREDGAWKIDQQIIVESPDIPKWFPSGGKPGAGGVPADAHAPAKSADAPSDAQPH